VQIEGRRRVLYSREKVEDGFFCRAKVEDGFFSREKVEATAVLLYGEGERWVLKIHCMTIPMLNKVS